MVFEQVHWNPESGNFELVRLSRPRSYCEFDVSKHLEFLGVCNRNGIENILSIALPQNTYCQDELVPHLDLRSDLITSVHEVVKILCDEARDVAEKARVPFYSLDIAFSKDDNRSWGFRSNSPNYEVSQAQLQTPITARQGYTPRKTYKFILQPTVNLFVFPEVKESEEPHFINPTDDPELF